MANDSIIGSIKIQLLEAIRAKFSTYEVAKDLIDVLQKEYASPGIAGAYALFKELLDMQILLSSHPTPGLSKVQTLFSHLKEVGYNVPANIQRMLLLVKLPSFMNVIMQMIIQAKNMAGKPVNPIIKGIYKAAVLSWNQCHMTGKGKQPVQANKISTMKPKRKKPTFQSQQQQSPHQPLQASDANAPGKRKQTRQGKKKAKSQDHAHFTSSTYVLFPLPAIKTTTPATVDPCLAAHQPLLLYQGHQGPSADT